MRERGSTRSFAARQIPTFAETIDELRGRPGRFIEVDAGTRRGHERLTLAEIGGQGPRTVPARIGGPRCPAVVLGSEPQIPSGTLGTKLPVHFLVAPATRRRG